MKKPATKPWWEAKRVARRNKKMHEDASQERDAWLRGYAAALAAVHRLYHEAQIVESVMRADGLTPLMLAAAGAESFDMKEIRRAWVKRKAGARRGGGR
jgi:hypothetical protein